MWKQVCLPIKQSFLCRSSYCLLHPHSEIRYYFHHGATHFYRTPISSLSLHTLEIGSKTLIDRVELISSITHSETRRLSVTMCGETHYFTDCSHQSDVYIVCSWKKEKYHRFLTPAKEGFCRSCNKVELTNALTGHCSIPREAAANMWNVINETRIKDVTTP